VTRGFLHGTVHEASEDLQEAVRSDPAVLALWQNLTPLGRNEFICWVDDAKQPKTRRRRIERTCEELQEGKKRPCCWAGCIHRTDKAPSRWQQAVLIDKQSTSRSVRSHHDQLPGLGRPAHVEEAGLARRSSGR
jgi:hypothetical protein